MSSKDNARTNYCNDIHLLLCSFIWTLPAMFSLNDTNGCSKTQKTRAGSRVVRIDPLRLLAGCLTRRLNQALSVLSLNLDFFSVCLLCCYLRPLFIALRYFVLFVCLLSVSWLFLLGCQYQCKRLTGKTRLRHDS